MKKNYLPLAVLLAAFIPCLAAARTGDSDVTALNNKDILLMVQNHLPTDDIVKAIKSSPCTFDTFPPVLRELRRKGVPEAVLEAMVEAPYGPSALNSSKDDLAEQPIYHFAEQLKQMGFLTPSVNSSRFTPRASNRSRSSRSRLRS